jgi:hypothetical protein
MTSLKALQNAEVSATVAEATGQPDCGPKKGGRPPLAAPPQTAAETRSLIATEIVKTTPNASKLRHLQKLLKSQQQAEEHAEVQAAALRKNALLAEANGLKRAEYQRRYLLGQQKLRQKLNATENAALQKTIASLRDELSAAPKPEQLNLLQNELSRLKNERETLLQENERLTATIQDLQPKADALARIKDDVQTEFGSMLNTDESVLRLRAEFDSLKTGERTMAVLERMKEIVLQLKTRQHAYQV